MNAYTVVPPWLRTRARAEILRYACVNFDRLRVRADVFDGRGVGGCPDEWRALALHNVRSNGGEREYERGV